MRMLLGYLLVCLLSANTHAMEHKSSVKTNPESAFTTFMQPLPDSTNHNLNELLQALKKNDLNPKKWPLVFLKGPNDLTKQTAQALVTALNKKIYFITAEELENPNHLKALNNLSKKQQISKNLVYVANNINSLLPSATKGYKALGFSNKSNVKVAELLSNLLKSCLVILTDEKTNILPKFLTNLLLKPFGTTKTVIPVSVDTSATKFKNITTKVTEWCLSLNINCAYRPSFNQPKIDQFCPISAEYTAVENIVTQIVNCFKFFDDLSFSDYCQLLKAITIHQVTVKTIEYTEKQPESMPISTRGIEITEYADKSTTTLRTTNAVTYSRAINLVQLREMLYNYADQQKTLLYD